MTTPSRADVVATRASTAPSAAPPSPLSLLAERARHPDLGRGRALLWLPSPATHPDFRVEWSYSELWSRAVAAAERLATLGAIPPPDVEPPTLSPLQNPSHRSDVIGVLIEEGPELAVALLAVAVAGCAVAPLSPADPPARLAAVLEDARCAAVLVDSRRHPSATVRLLEAARALPDGEDELVVVEASDALDAETTSERRPSLLEAPFADSDPETLSHVFFTSGSTGRPKGCLSTRAALAHYCEAKNAAHGVSAGDVVLVASPHTFDPSLGDFFATWAAGATAATASRADVFANLGACLRASAATHVTTTPTMLGTVPTPLGTDCFPNLRVVALGGEAAPASLVDAWLRDAPATTLAVTYGVTECCVYQTFAVVRDASQRRWLGTPLSRHGCRVVFARDPGDDPRDALRDDDPEDDDVAAEIWLAGPMVGVGYANDPTRTAERFVRRNECATACGTERWFRTGDVARRARREDGSIAFALVGRRDAQVKINGQRVELGEIEAALAAVAPRLVARVAVAATARSAKSGSNSGPRLVAWCVAPSTREVENASRENASDAVTVPSAATCDALRWLASSRLPKHMLPARFGFLAALPETSSGKVARGALARREPPPPPRRFDDDRIGDDSNDDEWICDGRERARLAKSRVFAAVSAAWTDALGLDAPARDPRARFDEHGGDSISALRACQRLRVELGVEDEGGAFGESFRGALAPAALLAARTLGAHARAVRDAAAAGTLGDAAAAIAERDAADDVDVDVDAEDVDVRDEMFAERDRTDDRTDDRGRRQWTLDSVSSSEGASLLRRVAAAGDVAATEQLLDHGVCPDGGGEMGTNPKNPKNRPRSLLPLHAACVAGTPGAETAATALLRRGANATRRARRGATPLILAAARCSTKLIAAILDAVDGQTEADDGSTGSRSGSRSRSQSGSGSGSQSGSQSGSMRKTVASKGASRRRANALVAVDDDGQSALHVAARSGASAKTIDFLVEAWEASGGGGASATERRDAWGRTPLHWAAVNGHRGAAAALIARGASASAKDDAGETPVDAAERRALCASRERPDGARASTWGDIATLLGGSGATKHLRKNIHDAGK